MDQDRSFSAQTFKYWEIFLSWLFKYPSRCYALEGAPFVFENGSERLRRFGKTYRERLGAKGIICSVTSSFKDVETVCEVLWDIFETVEGEHECDRAAAEVLTKAMAYRNLKMGHEIVFPVANEGVREMGTFVIDRVFDLWSQVKAFGLIPKGCRGAPLLLFRGTDFSIIREGGRASIISDLDPKGPGWSLFEKAQRPLHEWLRGSGRGARVMGHSLGGVVAAYTLIHEAALVSQDSPSYAFNFPGVPKEIAQKWRDLESQPPFMGFLCRGDVISKFGTLFGELYEVSFEQPLSPIRAHEMLLFAEMRGVLQKIHLEEENCSTSRAFYSKIQEQTSSMIYEFGLKFLFPN